MGWQLTRPLTPTLSPRGRGGPIAVRWPPGICLADCLSKKHPKPGQLELLRPMGIYGAPSPRENGDPRLLAENPAGSKGWGERSGANVRKPQIILQPYRALNKQLNLWVMRQTLLARILPRSRLRGLKRQQAAAVQDFGQFIHIPRPPPNLLSFAHAPMIIPPRIPGISFAFPR